MRRYHEFVAEYVTNGGQPPVEPDQMTIKELIARFWVHAEQYYADADGHASTEVDAFRNALKPLKALLAAKDLPYPWRHDLGELMSAVKDHYPAAASLEKDILTLSPYAVELRYDDATDPSVDEAQTAVRIAERLFSMATGLLGER